MRSLFFEVEKLKVIEDRLRFLKKAVDVSRAEEIVEILTYNEHIECVIKIIKEFQNKTFIFSDDIFQVNSIDAYKKILLQQKFSQAGDNPEKRDLFPKKLQAMSCYRIGLVAGSSLTRYELQRNKTIFSQASQQESKAKEALQSPNDFVLSIFSEIKKNEVLDYCINSVLLEALLELMVLEKIHYRIEVILALKNLKETLEYNGAINGILMNIESCDGKLSTMNRLIDLATKDRPGLFYNWRPEIGYGALYQNLKALQEEIEKGASLNAWTGLLKSAIEVQECSCF